MSTNLDETLTSDKTSTQTSRLRSYTIKTQSLWGKVHEWKVTPGKVRDPQTLQMRMETPEETLERANQFSGRLKDQGYKVVDQISNPYP